MAEWNISLHETRENPKDSPGIDCDGHAFTAHIGATFDLHTPPPLYASLPMISKPPKPFIYNDLYEYKPEKTNLGQSPLLQPNDVNFATFIPFEPDQDFETYTDAHTTTGLILKSQMSWQLNLRIAHGPNRSKLFPHAVEELLPFVVVRDRSTVNEEVLKTHGMIEGLGFNLNAAGVCLAILGKILLFASLMYLRGLKYFYSFLWTKTFAHDVYQEEYQDEDWDFKVPAGYYEAKKCQ
eukprot:gnl/MRDRNA2_/MRDRNA2_116967_c0_seq1.p1 gnl/MRDRNA2_/MRDRNA2_116967_c0~~gnl/MRDRNA2_/MRDRNA2_116967_c0_seq1.p1  ORF type:complete len:280 (+),score=47.70 gnl/MRDRNA2_/MRDRNA2_116967_c0_seq1:129-842(+)